MPKINWDGADPDDVLTAEDIEEAEEGFQTYTGEIPPGGVYRFRIGGIKFEQASTKTQGLRVRLILDGSWKPGHKKYDGCPLWDRIWMTKPAAGFVKAFAMAIGVSADDIVNKVIADEDGVVTKIGRKKIVEGELVVYCAVKKGHYDEQERLEKAGTGYQPVDTEEVDDEEPEEEAKPAKVSKKAAPAAAKSKAAKKSKAEDEEPPF
jgi:hypothetical protein